MPEKASDESRVATCMASGLLRVFRRPTRPGCTERIVTRVAIRASLPPPTSAAYVSSRARKLVLFDIDGAAPHPRSGPSRHPRRALNGSRHPLGTAGSVSTGRPIRRSCGAPRGSGVCDRRRAAHAPSASATSTSSRSSWTPVPAGPRLSGWRRSSTASRPDTTRSWSADENGGRGAARWWPPDQTGSVRRAFGSDHSDRRACRPSRRRARTAHGTRPVGGGHRHPRNTPADMTCGCEVGQGIGGRRIVQRRTCWRRGAYAAFELHRAGTVLTAIYARPVPSCSAGPHPWLGPALVSSPNRAMAPDPTLDRYQWPCSGA
jgi:hypothetical protein